LAATSVIVAARKSRISVVRLKLVVREAKDPAPRGHRVASLGAVIGVPACTAGRS
jgi:hypothetical protein